MATERFVLDVDRVAHGGHCVARHDGQVVFVRHALPGERVVAEITGSGPQGRYLRADAVEVLRASPDRVEPPCALSGPGGCGGCDFQHVSPAGQRRLKAAVVAEQLSRLAGLERDVVVEELPGSPDGLGWRTRVRMAVDPQGHPGFRRHRSHDVVAAGDCPLLHPAVQATGAPGGVFAGAEEVIVAASADTGTAVVAVDGVAQGKARLTERVGDRTFTVSGDGFWQVHPAAAATLTGAVLAAAAVQPGQTVYDLYAGVGLFTAPLAEAVGPDGTVIAVEASDTACRDARRNLHDLPQAHIAPARVDRWLAQDAGVADVVVLDPPRSGAGRAVISAIAAATSRIVYVACDPAALARDVRTLRDAGWQLSDLRAFDAFPMTHHVECVATLVIS